MFATCHAIDGHLLRALRRASSLALLLLIATAPVRAQDVAQDAGTQPAPAGADDHDLVVPDDPWNRGTPRGALRSFLDAARDNAWTDAAQMLDLSALPASERAERGPELARKLKYLLDQNLWIDLDTLSPDAAGFHDDGQPAGRELVGRLARAEDARVMLERGPREDGALIWRIGDSTLARVPALYAQLGPPPLIDKLPPVLYDTHFLEVALWQWIALIVLAVASWFAAWVAASFIVRVARPLTQRSKTDLDDKLLELTVGPIKLLCAVGAFNACLHVLRLSVPAHDFTRESSKFLVIAGVAWLALRIVDLSGSITRDRFLERGQTGAAHLVPLGARAIKVTVFIITVLATLDTFGFDVTAILAGLGVGGLAVALAAQKTVENIFGGVSVLVDQPVRPGDFCRFGDKVGTVEDIGLRSTRIRTLDRTVVSVPNADFSTMQLENFALRDRIRLLTTIGLRYETTPDQLRHVIAALRGLLIAHPKVLPDPLRVRLVNFGAYSIDIEMFAYVETKDFNEFLAVREDIFLRVMDIVAESGSGFAFPSNTTYFARDGGLDSARRDAAETEVARLREEGRLLFPDHPPEDVAALDDTLDWPPKGSVGAGK